MVFRFLKSGWSMLALVACAAWLPRAEAAPQDFNQLLRGNYAFTGEAACLVSQSGFNADFTPKDGFGVFSFSIQGVRTFNGDGTGSVVARTVQIKQSGLNAGTGSASELTANFTYNVAPDRTFAVDQGPTISTGVAGPGTGNTSVIDSISFSGYISQDLKTLVMSTDEPTIEIRRNSLGEIQDYRICHRARTAVKIH